MSVREREDASNTDISPVPVSELVDDRTGEPVENQANKIPKTNKKETTIERENLCDHRGRVNFPWWLSTIVVRLRRIRWKLWAYDSYCICTGPQLQWSLGPTDPHSFMPVLLEDEWSFAPISRNREVSPVRGQPHTEIPS